MAGTTTQRRCSTTEGGLRRATPGAHLRQPQTVTNVAIRPAAAIPPPPLRAGAGEGWGGVAFRADLPAHAVLDIPQIAPLLDPPLRLRRKGGGRARSLAPDIFVAVEHLVARVSTAHPGPAHGTRDSPQSHVASDTGIPPPPLRHRRRGGMGRGRALRGDSPAHAVLNIPQTAPLLGPPLRLRRKGGGRARSLAPDTFVAVEHLVARVSAAHPGLAHGRHDHPTTMLNH